MIIFNENMNCIYVLSIDQGEIIIYIYQVKYWPVVGYGVVKVSTPADDSGSYFK